MSVSTAVLLGEHQPELGAMTVEPLAGVAALGLSAGRLPKRYWHLDPNEDAVAVAVAGERRLLAAADGHNGCDASHAAIRAVAEVAAASLAEGKPAAVLEQALRAARDAVATQLRDAAAPRDTSRTALSIAVVGAGRVHAATWGDSSAARIRLGKRVPVRLLTAATEFLGPGTALPNVTSARLRRGDRVVVCSDGITDHLGQRWELQLAQSAAARAGDDALVDDLLRRACNGGAGDHLAVAVTTLR